MNTRIIPILLLLLCLSSGSAMANIVMSGNFGYSITEPNATVSADKVQNTGITASGTLHLKLIATVTPNIFGASKIFTMADVNLSYINGTGTLSPGTSFDNIHKTEAFNRPQDGTYYVHLAVVEEPNLDTVLAHHTFPDTLTFSSGGGSSGTLALAPLSILLIPVCGSLLRRIRFPTQPPAS